jgi:hypothetical protein
MPIQGTYSGPQCPRCAVTLPEGALQTGVIACPTCRKTFEGTAFTPVDKRIRITELAVSGPEGANACANHARNAAVTSCERCGLFICALCEMNIGEGSFCPSCFERARTEGTMQSVLTRRRDFPTMARATMVLGFLMLFPFGVVLGALAIYFSIKGRRQRKEDGDSTFSVTVILVLAIVEVTISALFLIFMIIGMMQ